MFNKRKAYGFIIADEAAGIEKDVYVHRKNIVCASNDLPFELLPFLLPNERVQFELNQDGDKFKALNVTNEDGTMVPIYRKDYAEYQKRAVKREMGLQTYDILNDDAMNEVDKVTHIMEQYEKAKERIEEIETAIQAEYEAKSEILEETEEVETEEDETEEVETEKVVS